MFPCKLYGWVHGHGLLETGEGLIDLTRILVAKPQIGHVHGRAGIQGKGFAKATGRLGEIAELEQTNPVEIVVLLDVFLQGYGPGEMENGL